MALDVCVENYGLVLHALESGWWDPAVMAGRRLRTGTKKTPRNDFAEDVRSSAAGLPYEQATTLWLVDVCGCTYAEAAIEMRTSRDNIRHHVSAGRQSLRRDLRL